MSRYGPIVIAEDDIDDQEILKEVFESLSITNELLFFETGEDVYNYLVTTNQKPFMIISDVNLVKMDGLELRRRINANDYLRKKSIPFIFLTTSSNHVAISEAYELMVQGYFKKENNFKQIQNCIRMIVEYWQVCRHPNSDMN
ncbi:MAG TPA: response regulator [Flavisolibacter sp.]